jgi:uncharacterized protein with HEPN domain
MSRNDAAIKLRHMRDAVEEALQIIENRTRTDLAQDRVLALALTRLLEIVGEAAKNVPLKIRTANPGLPWKALAGMRDRLAHRYFDVDLDIVWSVITQNFPLLLPQIDKILAHEQRII